MIPQGLFLGVKMLGKTKGLEPQATEPPRPVSSREKTVIGEQIAIEGGIRGRENLVIEGTVKGKIELEKCHLTVGSRGQVQGEIHAADVTVSGRLIGNIEAQGKVEITQEADFQGEIKAKSISVQDGAYLKAVIELQKEAKKENATGSQPVQQAAPAAPTASASGKEPIPLAGQADRRK
jgi:cytoskeletal protein CcmA (bactofilin family)